MTARAAQSVMFNWSIWGCFGVQSDDQFHLLVLAKSPAGEILLSHIEWNPPLPAFLIFPTHFWHGPLLSCLLPAVGYKDGKIHHTAHRYLKFCAVNLSPSSPPQRPESCLRQSKVRWGQQQLSFEIAFHTLGGRCGAGVQHNGRKASEAL